MYEVFWYGKKNEYAKSIYTEDVDAACALANALKRSKYKVFITCHTTDKIVVMDAHKDAYNQWLEDCEHYEKETSKNNKDKN